MAGTRLLELSSVGAGDNWSEAATAFAASVPVNTGHAHQYCCNAMVRHEQGTNQDRLCYAADSADTILNKFSGGVNPNARDDFHCTATSIYLQHLGAGLVLLSVSVYACQGSPVASADALQ